MEEDMERQRQNALKVDEEKIQLQKSSYCAQRRLLQQQIDERKIQFLDATKVEKDREIVDSITRRISEEDETDYRRSKEMQESTAKIIRDFENQRQQQREAAQAQERREEEANFVYNKLLEARYDRWGPLLPCLRCILTFHTLCTMPRNFAPLKILLISALH